MIAKGIVSGNKVKTEVGQGFKDKDRKRFWKMHLKNSLKGLVIEVEHYGLTSSLRKKEADVKVSALRNAIFLRTREDKMGR